MHIEGTDDASQLLTMARQGGQQGLRLPAETIGVIAYSVDRAVRRWRDSRSCSSSGTP